MMGKRSAPSLPAISSRSTKCKACILFRTFIYNRGLSGTAGVSLEAIAAELGENITPFCDAERLHTFRVLIRLFYVIESSDDRLHEFALEFVPKVLPDGTKFAEEIVAEYIRKTKEVLPSKLTGDPKKVSQWAKQSSKDQLVLLEVQFWAMFNYVQCKGPLVVTMYEAAYDTCLGSTQANNTLLLDKQADATRLCCNLDSHHHRDPRTGKLERSTIFGLFRRYG